MNAVLPYQRLPNPIQDDGNCPICQGSLAENPNPTQEATSHNVIGHEDGQGALRCRVHEFCLTRWIEMRGFKGKMQCHECHKQVNYTAIFDRETERDFNYRKMTCFIFSNFVATGIFNTYYAYSETSSFNNFMIRSFLSLEILSDVKEKIGTGQFYTYLAAQQVMPSFFSSRSFQIGSACLLGAATGYMNAWIEDAMINGALDTGNYAISFFK